MVEFATDSAVGGKDLQNLMSHLNQLATDSLIPHSRVREALVLGWCRAVNDLLQRGLISRDVEEALTRYVRTFGFSDSELDAQGARERFVQAAVLREITDGNVPNRISVVEQLPFNFLKSESLVWVFHNCDYYEDRVHTRRIGGYQGVSVRIMKGVYYHIGGFQSRPVQTHAVDKIDNGILAITNKHLYFCGSLKSFRLPFSKIVSFDPFSDAIAIHRDAANARPQIFKTGNGWFTYNLIANLAKIA